MNTRQDPPNLPHPRGTRPRTKAVLFFAGACNPNPGPARCAFVLFVSPSGRTERAFDLGDGTNNSADLYGAIVGLEAALEAGVTHVEVCGHSQTALDCLRSKREING